MADALLSLLAVCAALGAPSPARSDRPASQATAVDSDPVLESRADTSAPEPAFACPIGMRCCGDGLCDGRETCATCRVDCGACPIEP